jgi:protein-S-isoprenylcysteine O-methyltransferase Ste14
MSFSLGEFKKTKAYDLLMGLPLIAWFIYVMIGLRPVLGFYARVMLQDPGNYFYMLRFYSYFAAAAFAFLNIVMIVIRTAPVRRSKGISPRAFAVAGTFLAVGINRLEPAQLSLLWQSLALSLVLVGGIGSVIAISNLGKSFSIMPEARRLVTSGPYALARHPLYAAEMITIAGTAILYQQPWAALIAIGAFALLAIRSHFEEQVLTEQYPEYADYKKRVKRFGFI